MTVSTENASNTYVTTEETSQFPFTFMWISGSTIKCTYNDVEQTGIFIPNEDQQGNPGGVYTPDTPAPSGTTVRLERDTSIIQPIDYPPFTPFPAEDHEYALDRLTLICQELEEGTKDYFTELFDTPNNYEGAGGTRVVVKDTLDGLEFKEDTFTKLLDTPESYEPGFKLVCGPGFIEYQADTFLTLDDTPNSYTDPNYRLKVNSVGTGIEYAPDTFSELIDTPSSYTPTYRLKVDGLGVAIEQKPDTFLELEDTPETYSDPNYRLKVNSVGTAIEYAPDTFTELIDTPNSYTPNYRLKVDGLGVAIDQFPDTYIELEDVEDGSPSDNEVYVYRSALSAFSATPFLFSSLQDTPDNYAIGSRLVGGSGQVEWQANTYMLLNDVVQGYTPVQNDVFVYEDAATAFAPKKFNFIALADTPNNYTGSNNYVVKVNEAEQRLYFAPESGGGGGGIPTPLDYAADANLLTANGFYGFDNLSTNFPTLQGGGNGMVLNLLAIGNDSLRTQLVFDCWRKTMTFRGTTDTVTPTWSDWLDVAISGGSNFYSPQVYFENIGIYGNAANPLASDVGSVAKYVSANQSGMRMHGGDRASANTPFIHMHDDSVFEFQNHITMGIGGATDNVIANFDLAQSTFTMPQISTNSLLLGNFHLGNQGGGITGVGGPGQMFMHLQGNAGEYFNTGYVYLTGTNNSLVGGEDIVYIGANKTPETVENSELKIAQDEITIMQTAGTRRLPVAWLPDVKVETGVTYTLSEEDINTIVIHNQPTSSTYELNTTIGIPGSIIQILNAAGQGILLNVTGGGNLNWLQGGENAVGNRTIQQFSVVTLTKLADQSWTIWGNGLA